ncbi:DMT family transporter [Vibrio sp. T187]|uniref:DMT family transporter n=1 Tax=Vibrio TaxID=662 RepID=UPI0010C9B7EA|nr:MULTISPECIES: DMT family transporter [Vibrio]MBW3696850.1 DMT family transporter [Vibrio sp. T187]
MKTLVSPSVGKERWSRLGAHLQSPFYVISIGSLVAVNFALSKHVVSGGASPIDAAILPMVGAALLLVGKLLFSGQLNRIVFKHYRYYFWAGLLGVALPNLASTYALQYLTASTFSVLVTLSPIFTLIFNRPFQGEPLNGSKVLGILMGVGAALLVTLSPELDISFPLFSLIIALLVPICLAAGNVYRSQAYPSGANPEVLAAGMLTLQSVIWLPLSIQAGGTLTVDALTIFIGMASLSALSYLLTFRFQKMTDGVGFSQVGNVVTVVGVSIGVAWYGDPVTGQLMGAVFLLLVSLYLFNRRHS